MITEATDGVDLDAVGGGLAREELRSNFEELVIPTGVLAADSVDLGLDLVVRVSPDEWFEIMRWDQVDLQGTLQLFLFLWNIVFPHFSGGEGRLLKIPESGMNGDQKKKEWNEDKNVGFLVWFKKDSLCDVSEQRNRGLHCADLKSCVKLNFEICVW